MEIHQKIKKIAKFSVIEGTFQLKQSLFEMLINTTKNGNPFSAETVFILQNLTSVDVRI